MRAAGIGVVLLLAAVTLRAQSPGGGERLRLSHPLGAGTISATPVSSSTVRVLALMVEFRQDADPRTTGTGRFDRSAGNPAHLDPAPHDSGYFSSKLRFLQNYYRKVSRGRLTVMADLFPHVVELPDSMAVYAPGRTGTDAPLARLVVDSWTAAGSLAPAFPFGSYDAFILFHAGAGRDIDLVSLLGYDPTPFDIPSLTLDLERLRNLLGDPGYQGVPVGSGPSLIRNSVILPETESRVLETGFGSDTLQLSINGLLAASFGSYLGLPDLFDTKTGRSGIGQFGLMDGASIFALNGIFPPEPSAWEKMALGWIEPAIVSGGTHRLRLPAAGLHPSADDTVYRVEVAADEYFLIENRQRDPHGNGQVLTIDRQGTTVTKFFGSDTAGFQFGDLSAVGGSVEDVEDFDWALPGAASQPGFEGGGILVWHIDESVIRTRIADNQVNADPDRRGVDLEEADGSQDIGQSYELLQAGSGTEFGWPPDAWYEGNPAPVYLDRFDNTTFPNTRSNSAARSLVTMKEFSSRGPYMELTVTVGDAGVQRLSALARRFLQQGPGAPLAVTSGGLWCSADSTLLALTTTGVERTSDVLLASRPFSAVRGLAARETAHPAGTETFVVETGDSAYRVLRLVDVMSDGSIDSVSQVSGTAAERITSSPAMAGDPNERAFLIGTESGRLLRVGYFDGIPLVLRSDGTGAITGITQFPGAASGSSWDVVVCSGSALRGAAASATVPDTAVSWIISSVRTPRGILVIAAGGSTVVGFSSDLSARLFESRVAPGNVRSLAAADLNRDGAKEIIVTTRTSVAALNQQGVMMPGFPVALGAGDSCSAAVLIGDLSGNEDLELVTVTAQGRLMAWDAKGALLPGFPLQALARGSHELVLFPAAGGLTGIAGVSTAVTGDAETSIALEAYALSSPYVAGRVLWPSAMGGSERLNTDLTVTANPVARLDEYLPAAAVYNWPNPVYGTTTQIRYYVPQDASIRVEIFDLSGLRITELTGSAVGGLDGEITWNVEEIQSGVYLARVEASGAFGTLARIIKIAVVK